MRRKKNKATKKVHFESLPLIHPNAAGIDVGSKEHLVAVPPDRDPQPVRTFQAFTPDLHELAAWLKRCGIETVACRRRFQDLQPPVPGELGFQIANHQKRFAPPSSKSFRDYP